MRKFEGKWLPEITRPNFAFESIIAGAFCGPSACAEALAEALIFCFFLIKQKEERQTVLESS